MGQDACSCALFAMPHVIATPRLTGHHAHASSTPPRPQADICQLGMDQRKVNMLAREYCDATKKKFKPVILSHRMMPGLLEVRDWWISAARAMTRPGRAQNSLFQNGASTHVAMRPLKFRVRHILPAPPF